MAAATSPERRSVFFSSFLARSIRLAAHRLLGEDMLPGQDVPIGPQAGDSIIADVQGTEPLGRPAHRHIPVQLGVPGLKQLRTAATHWPIWASIPSVVPLINTA